MRNYNIDITVRLTVISAASQAEAEDIALTNFRNGKYNNDGVITHSADTEYDRDIQKHNRNKRK